MLTPCVHPSFDCGSVPVPKPETSQASYQPHTEPMTGMGIGLPLSRLFVRHFGGDLRIISIRGTFYIE